MPPPGAISSAARKPVSPTPAASSSTRWPGCGSIASTSHCETGIAAAWKRALRRCQPSAARSQRSRTAARSSSGSSVVGRRSSVAGSCSARGAAACRTRCAEVSPANATSFGTLKRASWEATCARSSSASAWLPSCSTTVATTASPHSRVRAAVDAGVGDGRMREQRRLDLGRRDVLAAADDRVGLAAGDREAALRVERAAVAGVQPAVGGGGAGRDGRPGDEDLAVVGDPHPLADERAAGRLRLARQRGRRPASRPPSCRRSARPGCPPPAPARRAPAASGPPPISATRSGFGALRPASSRRSSVVGTSETSVTRSRSIAVSAASVSKRSCSTTVVP